MITRLSRYHWLNVLTPNCTRAYKGRAADVKRTAKYLRAHSVVTGNVRFSTRIRVTGARNQVWTGDITYIATDEGWLDLAVVLDLFSRQVVGWSMQPICRARWSRMLCT